MEFHVSRDSRERYGFDEDLFSLTGNVVFPNFAASRRFAQRMNESRAAELAADPARTARPGDLNAMGLIDEVLHSVIELYRQQRDPKLMSSALESLEKELGAEQVQSTLRTFVEHFPTVAAYRGEMSADEYLRRETSGRPNREIALEELLLNWLANENPAYERYDELFDDRPIAQRTAYDDVVDGLTAFLAGEPAFGPESEDLVTLLRKPALEAPDSLAEQIKWLRERWGFALARLGDRLAIGLDVLSEDDRADWMHFHPNVGGAADGALADAAALHGFEDLPAEEEHFSQDLHWMPRLVLLAKSTYVWLDQLARAHGRPIWRLDQIPDEELDRLAGRGFSGLWLIGLWERSRASQTIKQLRGQPDAVASAYSLMDYQIADDLGGEEAYGNLRDRAWQRGIRLASDMVPNHMGIDSRWVVEHPDWFISRQDAPYPVYSYNGSNLSSDERVGIYLEDHYYDNSDAAVTFKRTDRWSGDERYVYHGNDGTSYPWNDTAQLDYLNPDVREAVIQTILHVARLFPVIRFDAAMTLAKKHIQRLWYPEPGTGGAIPSRAEYSMSRREFNRRMPQEFWREVVDRVAVEAPDTLLLAEAFWLMEGYFVRTLGMHRVYNSAFMNMLRDEKNAEYRLVVKNTLEFDPQILKRYVNFMNNPDEKSAVEQFGVHDKYFGVATVMATMPGLPMFGHGQVEGFTEKYGMEYRRARLEEAVNDGLVARHEQQIFPLLHRRELFAEVTDFAFYDFVTADGTINEDVFAYSNSFGGQRTLVVYHNKFGSAAGWIRRAAVTGRSLGEGMALADDETRFLVLRDHRSGLEFLRSQAGLVREGLYLELDAYRCHVFIELRDVADSPDGRWRRLAEWLGGRGVPSLEVAMREMELAPFHAALRAGDAEAAVREAAALLGVSSPRSDVPAVESPVESEVPLVESVIPQVQPVAAATKAAQAVDDLLARERPRLAGGRWIDEWLADLVLPNADFVAVMLRLARWPRPPKSDGALPVEFLRDPHLRRLIGVNDHEGAEWFNKEQFEKTVEALDLPVAQRQRLSAAAEHAGYRLDGLVAELTEPKRPAVPASKPKK